MDDDAALQWVRGMIRSHMVQLGFSYAALTQALRERFDLDGDEWNEKNVANKVARGTFSAVFFVQCLEAMGVSDIKLNMAGRVVTRADAEPKLADVGAEARSRARSRELQNRIVNTRSPGRLSDAKRRLEKESRDLE
ncbi:MAG: DUF6471 domain-containing protein [Caulobacterales bacterium]